MKSGNNWVSIFYNISEQIEEPLANLCVSTTVREDLWCSTQEAAIGSSGIYLTSSGPYGAEPGY